MYSKFPKRVLVHIICVFVITSALLADASVFEIWSAEQVNASTQNEELQNGDTLHLKTSTWDKEYIVLNSAKTNTKEEGIFLLQKECSEKIQYNSDDADIASASYWENSLAQEWCTNYYKSLPGELKNAIIGVRTQETESGYHWADINNIDGTRTGADSEKDKVFFLSYREHSVYYDYIPLGEKWLLRSPGTDCTPDIKVYIATVTEDGNVKNFGTMHYIPARPAFNLNSNTFQSVAKCKHGTTSTWIMDAQETDLNYNNIEYKWSDDNKTCTASGKCNICGESVSETSEASMTTIKQATTSLTGLVQLKAEFKDKGFDTQIREIQTPIVQQSESDGYGVLDYKLPGTKVKSCKKGKKSFTIKWKKISKKNAKKVKGIEIQYATDKAFSQNVSIKRVKKTKSSTKIKKLMPRKTYWVRVRTYINKAGVKHVSKWSKSKLVKTK